MADVEAAQTACMFVSPTTPSTLDPLPQTTDTLLLPWLCVLCLWYDDLYSFS